MCSSVHFDVLCAWKETHILVEGKAASAATDARVLTATTAVGLVSEVVSPATAAVVGTRLAGVLGARGRVDRCGAGAGRGL